MVAPPVLNSYPISAYTEEPSFPRPILTVYRINSVSNRLHVHLPVTFENITIAVSPARIDVAVRQGLQFTVTITEGGRVIPSNVVWSVNGIIGGNPTVGTITQAGIYTAPASIPRPPTVTVTATSAEEMTSSASAAVTIVQGIGPIFAAASERANPVDALLSPIVTQGASYRSAPVAFAVSPIFEQGASYRTAPQAAPVSPIFDQGSSYRVGRPDQMAIAPIFNQGSSYTTIAITGLSLSRVTRGAMDIAFTVMGRNFNGATGLDFLLPDATRDANITATGLTVNPDGTQITARISVGASASIGARTIVVRTPMGASTTTATDSNQLVIE